MIKSFTHFLINFFIFQQLKSQISKIDQNGYNPFCDETLQLLTLYMKQVQDHIRYNNKLFKNTIPFKIILNVTLHHKTNKKSHSPALCYG